MAIDDDQTLLRPGDTCWRLEDADRAAFLIDSADYFSALKTTLLSAKRSIWILAWTFDPLARLTPDRTVRSRDPEAADRLGLLLRRMASLNPGLDVRVLAWAMPPGIAASQLFAPQRGQAYFHGSRVRYKLDDTLPKSGCHHQKVVIIDNRLAFVSGGDVGADRWDTPRHHDHDTRRRLPSGGRYAARHEVTAMIEGQAAVQALSDLFIARWRSSEGETPVVAEPAYKAEDSLWPAQIEPDLWRCRLGIARTSAHWKQMPRAQEVLHLHLAAIACARQTLYIENQYLTAAIIVEALARRLRAEQGPEIILVGPDRSPSSFDRLTMDAARQAAIRKLREADRYGRFHAYSARTPKGSTIIVHSKVIVADDRLVRIGSANLNNRSMGLDSECDVAFEAHDDAQDEQVRSAIVAFRNRLIGHYIDSSGPQIDAAVRRLGSLSAAIEALDDPDCRRLAPVSLRPPTWFQKVILHYALGDPTAPSDAWRPWRRRRRIATQLATLLPTPAVEDPAPPPGADDLTPPGRALRTASPPV